MADMAASVLARLKNRRHKAAEAISSAYSFSVRKSSCAVWKDLNMQKTSF